MCEPAGWLSQPPQGHTASVMSSQQSPAWIRSNLWTVHHHNIQIEHYVASILHIFIQVFLQATTCYFSPLTIHKYELLSASLWLSALCNPLFLNNVYNCHFLRDDRDAVHTDLAVGGSHNSWQSAVL